MNRAFERRLNAVETRRQQTALSSLSDAELESRIRELDAMLLQHFTPEQLREEMRAIGCSDALLEFMDQRKSIHAQH